MAYINTFASFTGGLMLLSLLLTGCGGSGTASSAAPNASVTRATVSAAGGANQVTVSWNPVAGATSYNIYWSTSNGVSTVNGTKIENATSPYIHNGLNPSTTYYYIVTAITNSGEGTASNQVSATTNTVIPPPPTNVTAISGTNLETVSWAPVTGATSYNIYWTNDPTHVMKDMGATKISGVTSPYRHTNLSAGSVYAYVVTAVNASGESSESDIASATTSTVDGIALYTAKCAGCHNPLQISEKKGRTVTQIQGAINANRGGMGTLSTLTASQIQAIADVLGF